jgi:hypothetical protein
MTIDIGSNVMKILMVGASLGAFALAAWSSPGIAQTGLVGLGGALSAWALGKRPGDVRRPRTAGEVRRYVSEIPAPLLRGAGIVSLAPSIEPGPLDSLEPGPPAERDAIPVTLAAYPEVPKVGFNQKVRKS